MRYLSGTDDAPTQLVKTVGEVCAILIYSAIVGLVLYAVLLH
jgi:hypothetical protein